MVTRRAGAAVAAAASVLFGMSGCALDSVAAAGAGAAGAQQDAAAAQREAGQAKLTAGRFVLVQVAQAAGIYAQLHDGSTSGFADEFKSTEPQVVAQLTEVDDSHAEVSVPQVGCLTVMLPAGTPTSC